MEWYEAIREYRIQKNCISPGDYTVHAVARRAGMDQSAWSRMELGFPKKQDGSSPEPTMKKLRMCSEGLNEPIEVIHKIVGLPMQIEETPTWKLAMRLRTLLENLPKDKQPQVEEQLVDIARVLVGKAA